MSNNYTVDYSFEDFVEFYHNQILLNWIQDHHPEVIEKARIFLSDTL